MDNTTLRRDDAIAAGLARRLTNAIRMLRTAGAFVRQFAGDWRRRQRTRDIVLALRELDSHTLRDLGLHRSEIQSLAAEVAGTADAHRMQSGRVQRDRPLARTSVPTP